AAVDAVERYAALQAEIKELETQLNEAKQTIIDYCQSEDLNRVYGSEYEITYKLVERTGFSEDEVRTILEPDGLWEKVLGFDEKRLKELLADKSTAGEIKKKLESVRRITSTFPQLRLKRRTEEEEE
ncbi:MAG: hypothetical protein JXA51_02750, partial [Dehalococcoidales bacterium]|nr:hypothetical protein [Dehalococcoidales bacterium]